MNYIDGISGSIQSLINLFVQRQPVRIQENTV